MNMSIKRFLVMGTRSFFDFPAEMQRRYLRMLGIATNNIDRAHKQYLCQRFFTPYYIRITSDLIAFFITPPLLGIYYIKSIGIKREKTIECIGEFKGMEEIIPDDLKRKYSINNDLWLNGENLSFQDLIYVINLAIRHPLSPIFVLKCLIKVAKYSYMIYCHTPKAIAVHNEYSFTSSLLTDYCNNYGVKHINVMHGEKLYNIRDSYFHYNICYVWEKYYANLFIELNAEPSQFIVDLPSSMKINVSLYKNNEDFADYKYYLGYSDEIKLTQIAKAMNFATKEGKIVKYRLHPRYSNKRLVESILGKNNIEYPEKTSILYSLSNCECVIGSYSTVLNQAYNSGIPVMLDDVAEKELFDKLKSYKYILSHKELPRLSEKQ